MPKIRGINGSMNSLIKLCIVNKCEFDKKKCLFKYSYIVKLRKFIDQLHKSYHYVAKEDLSV
jgi:hypothetical protein